MRTRILMSSCAIFLGLTGTAATFLPQEILSMADADESAELIVQISGAAYLGFAILNWMARGIVIGGIYSRPVALGNFLHFTIVALELLRIAIGGTGGLGATTAAAVYMAFSVAFGILLFTHPAAARQRPTAG